VITGQIEERQPLFETVDKSQLFRRSRGRVAHRGGHKNGHRTQQDTGFSEVRLHHEPANDAGMQTPELRIGRVLGMLCEKTDHADASPVLYSEDGTVNRPKRRGQLTAHGLWCLQVEGHRLFGHADDYRCPHRGAGIYDRRERSRFGQIDLAETNELRCIITMILVGIIHYYYISF